VPTDIAVERCVQGSQWIEDRIHEPALSLDTPPPWLYPLSAKTSFDLPLSYDTLFLLSRGSQSYGSVKVVTSQSSSQVARVHLVVRYLDRDTLDSGAKVCLVQRKNNQLGVGIFVCSCLSTRTLCTDSRLPSDSRWPRACSGFRDHDRSSQIES
jgi:hypothetical protein